MRILKRAGKSVSGGRLWHIQCKGKTVGHVVEIGAGYDPLYAIHTNPDDPGDYYLAYSWDSVCCSVGVVG